MTKRPRRHKRPPVWQLITSNMYTFRERKEQDEDDIMICQVGAGRSHELLHPHMWQCWLHPSG